MTKWEYSTVFFNSLNVYKHEIELDNYGKDGWELCSVVRTPDGYHAYLKRPLNESPTE